MAIVDLRDNAVARICGHMTRNCEAKWSLGRSSIPLRCCLEKFLLMRLYHLLLLQPFAGAE